MKKLLLVVALFCTSGQAIAGKAANTFTRKVTSSEMLSGAALNAAAASRTMTLTVDGNWAKLRLAVAYTYSAATSVTLTPTCSLDGTNYDSYSTRGCSSGACEVHTMTDVVTGTANFNKIFEYDIKGCDFFKVVFSGGGSPGAGDLITTRAAFVAGE